MRSISRIASLCDADEMLETVSTQARLNRHEPVVH
jgi:hypothetical protein